MPAGVPIGDAGMKFLLAALIVVAGLTGQAAAQVRAPQMPTIIIPPPPPPPPPPNFPTPGIQRPPICHMECSPPAFCPQGQVCAQNCRQVCN